jgi:NodT family efflux transporter outer membrane factor (OMF) lipoprotein
MRKATILLVLTLAGCATSPAYRRPVVQVPPAFRETKDTIGATFVPLAVDTTAKPSPATERALAQAEFWKELGDTTLNRLLDELARANLDVRAAEARVRGARAARLNSALDLAPTITAAGGYTRQRLSSATFPIGGGRFPDQDIWDAGFDASWEVDLFGRLRRTLQAQGALVTATREDLRDVQVTLSADLARAYFDLRGSQELLAVAQRNAENQQRTLEVTRQRLEAGRGTAFDTERALAQLNFTLATIPALQSRVADAQYQIGVLVGRPPAAVASELQMAVALPDLPKAVSVSSPDSVIRHRPDVSAAERQLAAERAFVGAAKADYLPRLSVGGSAGYSADALSRLGDNGTFRYAVGPVLSWPFLNLGRVKAGVDAAQARRSEAEAQYNQTVLRELQEVESALIGYRTTRARVERFQDAASASERAAELARLRFSGGVADFLQVLDAERTQLDAESQLAQSRTDAATAYAVLYKALGGWPTGSEQ